MYKCISIIDYKPEVAIEKVDKTSETVPNQALSLEEIWKRSQNGLMNFNSGFETGDDECFEDAFTMDIDLSDISRTREQIEELQNLLHDAEKKSSEVPTKRSEVRSEELDFSASEKESEEIPQ